MPVNYCDFCGQLPGCCLCYKLPMPEGEQLDAAAKAGYDEAIRQCVDFSQAPADWLDHSWPAQSEQVRANWRKIVLAVLDALKPAG
jgi:hypothetical protein